MFYAPDKLLTSFEKIIVKLWYEPHEIEIKLLERAKEIEICAKHADEKGSVIRVFTQKYTLPDNAETSELTSVFQDGHLKIMCPLKERQEPVSVPIQRF